MRRPPAPLVIAHRGASGHRPENTARAYELAIELAAGSIQKLTLQVEDKIALDLRRLKALAR